MAELNHYKGLATTGIVPEKFGKSRLGRIKEKLLEEHDDITELILPEGKYEVAISLSNYKKWLILTDILSSTPSKYMRSLRIVSLLSLKCFAISLIRILPLSLINCVIFLFVHLPDIHS